MLMTTKDEIQDLTLALKRELDEEGLDDLTPDSYKALLDIQEMSQQYFLDKYTQIIRGVSKFSTHQYWKLPSFEGENQNPDYCKDFHREGDMVVGTIVQERHCSCCNDEEYECSILLDVFMDNPIKDAIRVITEEMQESLNAELIAKGKANEAARMSRLAQEMVQYEALKKKFG